MVAGFSIFPFVFMLFPCYYQLFTTHFPYYFQLPQNFNAISKLVPWYFQLSSFTCCFHTISNFYPVSILFSWQKRMASYLDCPALHAAEEQELIASYSIWWRAYFYIWGMWDIALVEKRWGTIVRRIANTIRSSYMQ